MPVLTDLVHRMPGTTTTPAIGMEVNCYILLQNHINMLRSISDVRGKSIRGYVATVAREAMLNDILQLNCVRVISPDMALGTNTKIADNIVGD